MPSLLKFVWVTALVLVVSGCGSLPPEAFDHSTKITVRRVCLASLGVPERPQVTVTNPVGAGFGVVGTLIESHRQAGAQQEMQAILAKASYDYQSALTRSVFYAMGKAGFTMVRSSEARPEKERSKFLDRYPDVQKVDAFLDVYADYVGFQAFQSSEDYRPHLEISARLVDAKSGRILYQGRIVYGLSGQTDEDAVLVRAEDNVRFRDRTALQADPTQTARALQGAIDAVSWELAKQFM